MENSKGMRAAINFQILAPKQIRKPQPRAVDKTRTRKKRKMSLLETTRQTPKIPEKVASTLTRATSASTWRES